MAILPAFAVVALVTGGLASVGIDMAKTADQAPDPSRDAIGAHGLANLLLGNPGQGWYPNGPCRDGEPVVERRSVNPSFHPEDETDPGGAKDPDEPGNGPVDISVTANDLPGNVGNADKNGDFDFNGAHGPWTNDFSPELVRSLGLRENGDHCHGELSTDTSNVLSYNKLLALKGGGVNAAMNGWIDYDEARAVLGLTTGGFLLEVEPFIAGVDAFGASTAAAPANKVLHIGDYYTVGTGDQVKSWCTGRQHSELEVCSPSFTSDRECAGDFDPECSDPCEYYGDLDGGGPRDPYETEGHCHVTWSDTTIEPRSWSTVELVLMDTLVPSFRTGMDHVADAEPTRDVEIRNRLSDPEDQLRPSLRQYNTLVIGNKATLDSISAQTQQLIKDWVAQGGVLITLGGASHGSWLDAWLDVDSTSAVDALEAPNLHHRMLRTPNELYHTWPSYEVPDDLWSLGATNRDAYTRVLQSESDEDAVALATTAFGFGRVVITAFRLDALLGTQADNGCKTAPTPSTCAALELGQNLFSVLLDEIRFSYGEPTPDTGHGTVERVMSTFATHLGVNVGLHVRIHAWIKEGSCVDAACGASGQPNGGYPFPVEVQCSFPGDPETDTGDLIGVDSVSDDPIVGMPGDGGRCERRFAPYSAAQDSITVWIDEFAVLTNKTWEVDVYLQSPTGSIHACHWNNAEHGYVFPFASCATPTHAPGDWVVDMRIRGEWDNIGVVTVRADETANATVFGDARPQAPTALAATPGLPGTGLQSTVQLSWVPPVDDGGYAITAYAIYRGTSPATLAFHDVTYGASTSYLDDRVYAGTYYYEVAAVNAAGEGGHSNQANAVVLAGAPGETSSLSAVAGPTAMNITLAWLPPDQVNGDEVQTYKIYRGTTSGAYSLLAEVDAVNTAFVDEVPAAQTYYYVVTANHSGGEGTYSNEASATALAGLPGAPSTLVATPLAGKKIQLAWLVPDDGGSPITGYNIYRSTINNDPSPTLVHTATGITWTDGPLAPLTTYYYKVRAVNAEGEGGASNQAFAVTTAL